MRIDDVVGNVRRCIQAMEGYVPGKQPTGGAYMKLNTNENPYPPSPQVLEALPSNEQTLVSELEKMVARLEALTSERDDVR